MKCVRHEESPFTDPLILQLQISKLYFPHLDLGNTMKVAESKTSESHQILRKQFCQVPSTQYPKSNTLNAFAVSSISSF